jgi:hypothetical protein
LSIRLIVAARRGRDVWFDRATSALAWYPPGAPRGDRPPYGLIVPTLEGDAIAAITWFADTGALRRFGLPRTLPNPRALADVASLLTPGSSKHHHKIAAPGAARRLPATFRVPGSPLWDSNRASRGSPLLSQQSRCIARFDRDRRKGRR